MKTFWKGLAVAAAGGFTTGLTQAIQTSGHVTTGTLIVGGIGALGTVLAYLAKSPLTKDAVSVVTQATDEAQKQ